MGIFQEDTLQFYQELIQESPMACGMQEVRLDDQKGPFWP